MRANERSCSTVLPCRCERTKEVRSHLDIDFVRSIAIAEFIALLANVNEAIAGAGGSLFAPSRSCTMAPHRCPASAGASSLGARSMKDSDLRGWAVHPATDGRLLWAAWKRWSICPDGKTAFAGVATGIAASEEDALESILSAIGSCNGASWSNGWAVTVCKIWGLEEVKALATATEPKSFKTRGRNKPPTLRG